ncbi:Rossmann-like and DUF2520 domain-containing protein [Tunicatimonas pelagia]|uniref:Rossmann-like and DUF2520 domain-containing protein n=1 Tax=Tunicatimonas pelagia TaxID=931531 RepID=UPI002665899F|nr:Rossmann-like and DUF2520 domain-containing protein [Tunicatimonas pelagia]WKN45732.1 DUF2520 domain-containing protein [Tunicatimonas pelagia]
MINSYQKITIVGAGNVAWHLAPALEKAGCSVVQVYGRQSEKARALASQLKQTQVKTDLDFSDSSAHLFILAVSDDAIAEVARQIKLSEESAVVHTSGGQPMDTLTAAPTQQIGVFYPLQTFSKQRAVHFKTIPICVEANNKELLDELTKLAQKISNQVQAINSQQRAVLHVAAVFANNFTNHLLRMAEQLLHDRQLDSTLLHPLIQETISKSLEISPAQSQTGPAWRNDQKTITHHLDYLQAYDPSYAEVYRALTGHIQSLFTDKFGTD